MEWTYTTSNLANYAKKGQEFVIERVIGVNPTRVHNDYNENDNSQLNDKNHSSESWINIIYNYAVLMFEDYVITDVQIVPDRVWVWVRVSARRSTNVQLFQNFILLWLNDSINEDATSNIVAQLRQVIYNVKTFADVNQLVDFSNDMKDVKIFMIFSEEFAQTTVPIVHDMPQDDPDLIGVLFQITVNPLISLIPFADISDVSYYQTEEEILFSMHSVCRIGDIKQIDDNNRLWEIELALTSDNDPQLSALTEHIRQDTLPYQKGWYRLGQLLITLGQTSKAQQLETITETTTSTSSSITMTSPTITTPQTTTSTITMTTTQESHSPKPGDGICANATWTRNGETVAGGNKRGSALNQLNYPYGLFVDNNQVIYVVDKENNRVVKWDPGASSGQLVAGGNGEGEDNNQLNGPIDVVVDTDGVMYITDTGNGRVQRWPRGAQSGETVVEELFIFGIAQDDQGTLYLSNEIKYDVRKWRVGETVGQLITSELSFPRLLFVDRSRSIYIADSNNHRVVKVDDGATQISIVATGYLENSTAKIENPTSVVVDELGTVYLSDSDNQIIRWLRGAKFGHVIVGGYHPGFQSDQLFNPTDIAFDSDGNLYVVDSSNHRVQKFAIDKSMC
ncbi:hypothetical protein I4U23_005077 [Adineta vaga]|nr:hypothetical protein I4U23_005077 [Adineta vaga]